MYFPRLSLRAVVSTRKKGHQFFPPPSYIHASKLTTHNESKKGEGYHTYYTYVYRIVEPPTFSENISSHHGILV